MSKQIPSITLDDLTVDVKRGLSSYYRDQTGMLTPFINIKDVREGFVDASTVDRVMVRKTEAFDKSAVRTNDVIITVKGSTFKAAIVDESVEGYVISANLIALTVNEILNPVLLVAYLNSPKGQKELISRAGGTMQKSLNLRSLLQLRVAVPPVDIQKKLTGYISLMQDYSSLMLKEKEIREGITHSIIVNKIEGK